MLWRLSLSHLLLGYHRRFLSKDFSQDSHQVHQAGFIPELDPLGEIWMVDPSVATDVLTRPDYHAISGRHVADWWISWVVRHPHLDGELICVAAKFDWHGAGEEDEECRYAILIRCRSVLVPAPFFARCAVVRW
jgi:hypothetical protein